MTCQFCLFLRESYKYEKINFCECMVVLWMSNMDVSVWELHLEFALKPDLLAQIT